MWVYFWIRRKEKWVKWLISEIKYSNSKIDKIKDEDEKIMISMTKAIKQKLLFKKIIQTQVDLPEIF